MPNTKKPSAKSILAQTMTDLLHKKPFQKISVNELCETANLSRSAFYANFEDKYQLFAYCMEEKHTDLETIMSTHSPQDFLTVILDFLQSEDRFFYHAFGFSHDEEVAEIFYRFFARQLTALLEEKAGKGDPLPGPIDLVSAFYIGGLVQMVSRWVKSNYKLPKEEVAACQYRLLKDIV
ncbi:MAG: TetR/AcrR family transcriptional regulator C-terminal domain-containing protein [Eubacteriales bacterium]|nr:TetR/AcrR family transcriptional regulator C-terminal domain-containing protein [Eubacteriales bacterium]